LHGRFTAGVSERLGAAWKSISDLPLLLYSFRAWLWRLGGDWRAGIQRACGAVLLA